MHLHHQDFLVLEKNRPGNSFDLEALKSTNFAKVNIMSRYCSIYFVVQIVLA